MGWQPEREARTLFTICVFFVFITCIHLYVSPFHLEERDGDKDLASTGTLLRCLQQPGARNSIRISHMGGRANYLSHHLLPLRTHVSGELEYKWSWDLNSGTLCRDASIPSTVLTTRPNTTPVLFQQEKQLGSNAPSHFFRLLACISQTITRSLAILLAAGTWKVTVGVPIFVTRGRKGEGLAVAWGQLICGPIKTWRERRPSFKALCTLLCYFSVIRQPGSTE